MRCGNEVKEEKNVQSSFLQSCVETVFILVVVYLSFSLRSVFYGRLFSVPALFVN